MFTPEFINDERGEFVLVANHNLENNEAVQLSVLYNQSRIAFGLSNLPEHLSECRLIYDIRGQNVSEDVLSSVQSALGNYCTVEFKR